MKTIYACLCAILLCALVSNIGVSARPQRASDSGKYYWLMSGITFFINNPKGIGFDADIAVKDMKVIGRGPLEVVVKVEDPDGRLLYRKEVPPARPKPPVADRDGRAALLLKAARFVQNRQNLDALPSKLVKATVKAGKPGVYRLTVMGTWDDIIRLRLSKPLKYGIMSQSNHLAGIGDDYATGYIYIPRDSSYIDLWVVEGFAEDDCTADTPLLGGRNTILSTLDGKMIAEINDKTGRAAEIGAVKYDRNYRPAKYFQVGNLADQVLKLTISKGAPFKIHMAMGYKRSMYVRGDSYQAILCPDEATARAIHGGVTYYPTGGMAFNPWQTRLYDYISKTKVDDYRLKNPDGSLLELKLSEEEWGRALVMNRFLPGPGPWKGIADAMGGIPKSIEDSIAAMSDPTDIHEFYWKANLPAWAGLYLGYLYKYPFEGNGFYKHPAVLKLCLLSTCRAWMSMALGNQCSSRQTQGMSIAYDMGGYWPYWELARFVGDEIPAEMKAALTDGMFACADRMSHDFFMHYNNMNQITCMPMRMYSAYLATGDERVARLAQQLLYRVIDGDFGDDSGQLAAGDYAEGWAHDTTYGGYSMTEIARYYLLTKDPRALESVRRGFRLFNYIVMPDLTNPTVWASRYGGNVQFWGECYNYVGALLPEAARYIGPQGPIAGDGALAGAPPKWMPGVTPPELPPDIAFAIRDWKNVKRAVWAGDSPTDFTTDINNSHEFYAVKRRSYYALIFAGRLHPPVRENLQGMGGGGIALICRPKTGPVVIGKVLKEYGSPIAQWREFQANGMVGFYDGGKPLVAHSVSCPDSKLAGTTLSITGRVRRQPFRMQRQYRFNDTSIDVSCALLNGDKRKEGHSIEELYEAIPLADPQAELFDKNGGSLGALSSTPMADVASIRVGKADGGLTIRLDRPRPVHLSGTRTLFVELPDRDNLYHKNGIRLSYTIEPY